LTGCYRKPFAEGISLGKTFVSPDFFFALTHDLKDCVNIVKTVVQGTPSEKRLLTQFVFSLNSHD